MGYYIEVPERHRKVEQILAIPAAEAVVTHNTTWTAVPAGKMLVCVVQNGHFDAAGIAYSEDKRDAFAYPDGRPKTWLWVSRKWIEGLYPDLKGGVR